MTNPCNLHDHDADDNCVTCGDLERHCDLAPNHEPTEFCSGDPDNPEVEDEGEDAVGVRLHIQLNDGFSLYLDSSMVSIYVFAPDGSGARSFGETTVMREVVDKIKANW